MQIFNRDRTTNLVLPIELIDKFVLLDTTPSVLNCNIFKTINVVPVSITTFDDGAEGQTIKILGEGQTTINNTATVKTNTGAPKLLAANTVYTFTLIEGVWYEAE